MTYTNLATWLTKSGHTLHHTASSRGYVSRKADSPVEFRTYKGKFGEGYAVYTPRWDTTQFCNVEYWVR